MNPIIFTGKDCPECEALKLWCKGRIEFKESTTEEMITHPARNIIMTQMAMQDMSLPIVWWRGEAMPADVFRSNVLYTKDDEDGDGVASKQ